MISPLRLPSLVVGLVMAGSFTAPATETQRFYLSGRDKDNTVPWRFFCTSGANSGVWTNLPVPSHWDMQGFGTLTYKKDATNAWNERGLYEHDFAVPADWTGKRVFLVFEGVMTDTSAKLNGESVGPTHQGGFYRFKYEVTKLVKFGATNRLEVDVARHSANESVNLAERLADYWVFAGIYRPVYLEAVPQSFIERVAIDARADGSFAMDVFANRAAEGDFVEAQVLTLEGKAVGEAFAGKGGDWSAGLRPGTNGDNDTNAPGRRPALRLNARVPSPLQWTAETPNLYQVEVRLKRGGDTIHVHRERFGFRTFEVRDGDGLYLNGRKIILKGVNRHSFWPDSGRCLSGAVHRLDIETIKAMNGNAVRMAHYPPDKEFLDLCDALGLYVLNELAGWHNHYDTPTGTRLVEAMVTRDVNHPSILFWNNGNEGGSNPELDKVFHQFDPQRRRVLHPWALHAGINTAHYLMFTNAEVAARGAPMYWHPKDKVEKVDTNLPNGWIYLPTEFMHGLYDGGAGAGLADYWSMMLRHSNCAGGFIWVFADEAVKRPDTGELDSAGNQAPDGIVGPYREREGSFYAIQQLWSPIQVRRETDGTFTVENQHSFTDVRECRFTWELRSLPHPLGRRSQKEVLEGGHLEFEGSPTPDGGRARLVAAPAGSPGPKEFLAAERVLVVAAQNPAGREVGRWTFPVQSGRYDLSGTRSKRVAPVQASATRNALRVRAGQQAFTFDKSSGHLVRVEVGGQGFSLTNGPRLAAGSAKLVGFQHQREGFDQVVRTTHEGALKTVVWRVMPDGRLHCHFTYTATGTNDALGVLFDYPEQFVRRKRWLGEGPYRVWKNRLGGGTLGVWENDYNNTITGHSGWVYPEFKGCFANVRWLQLETIEGLITVVPENLPFVQVLTPEFPPTNLVGHACANLPKAGLGFLHAIPPIGSKFKPASTTGPQGQPNLGQGEYSGTVNFHFGKLLD